MVDETRDVAPPKGPRDLMWATFRRAHPEVTLVLLPGAPPRDVDKPNAAATGAFAAQENAPRVPLAEAREAMAALTRKLALVAEMMQCTDTEPTAGGWQPRDGSLIRPQVQLRIPATESTPTDGELIALRLGRLGWTAVHRPERKVVWVEARASDALLRVTVIEDWINVRMTGEAILVNPKVAEALKGGDSVRRN